MEAYEEIYCESRDFGCKIGGIVFITDRSLASSLVHTVCGLEGRNKNSNPETSELVEPPPAGAGGFQVAGLTLQTNAPEYMNNHGLTVEMVHSFGCYQIIPWLFKKFFAGSSPNLAAVFKSSTA